MRRALDQVFLRRRAGRFEALLVIERETGARERVTLPLSASDVAAAVVVLGRHLARSAAVDTLSGARLRVERGGGLVDAPELAAALAAAFASERRRDEEEPWS
jgi:hypothetical protein